MFVVNLHTLSACLLSVDPPNRPTLSEFDVVMADYLQIMLATMPIHHNGLLYLPLPKTYLIGYRLVNVQLREAGL